MDQIIIAKKILQNGGIIAYPTEAVFGLGCDPLNESAVLRLLTLKQRPASKGLIIIAADWQQLQNWVQPIPAERFAVVQQSWPGPYTWVFPASAAAPAWICGEHQSIAIRVTAHPVAKALCQAFGRPLVSTSANIASQAPAQTAEEVKKIFDKKIDLIVEGEIGKQTKPTIIRDALSDKLLRG